MNAPLGLAALARELCALAAQASSLARVLPELPRTTPELDAILDEIAAAEAEVGPHFERFAAEVGVPYDDRSEAYRESWDRIYRRREAAVSAIVRFAVHRAVERAERATLKETTAQDAPEAA
jgi:hypothetical protein